MICDMLILEFSLFKISLNKVLSFLLKACFCVAKSFCQYLPRPHEDITEPPNIVDSFEALQTHTPKKVDCGLLIHPSPPLTL